MAPPYSSFEDLAAEQVEGVDYTRTAVVPAGAFLSAIAIHGGGIEPGTGELARHVAGDRMAFYEFAGIKASGNSDLHITSTLFDEPLCLDLQAKVYRTISFHGYTGTTGLAETQIGGLDGRLRELIRTALTNAGFTVVDAVSEVAGADPDNIANRNRSGAGVQLELSRALRESFFPGGDLSAANRASGVRTQAFYDYANAVLSAVSVALAYDGTLSRVQLNTVAPGLFDDFARDNYTAPQNLNTSFEVNTAGWFATGGTLTRSTAQAHDGVASALLTPDGASVEAKAFNGLITVTASRTFRASAWVRCAVSRNVVIGIDWHQPESGGSAYISSSLQSVAVTANTWTRIEVVGTAPANAGRARITVSMTGSPPASHLLHIDEAELRQLIPGWGTSTSGHAYLHVGGTDTDYQVIGGVGQHILPAINVSRWSLAAVSALDCDVTAVVSTGALAVGGSQFLAVGGRLSDDATTGYLARLDFNTSQEVVLTLRKRVSGTETFLVQDITELTHQAGQQYAVRLQVVGQTLRGKCWLASGPEPPDWNLQTTDPDIDQPGRIGCRSILSVNNANTLPFTTTWHEIITRGVALVERSANGVTWTTVRGGADLDGAAGASIELDDYEFTDSVANHYRVRVVEADSGATLFVDGDQITPQLDTVWLKSLARPFLNRPVTVTDWSDVTRSSRSGVFPIVGRSRPVVVTDLHGPRQWTLDVVAHTEADAENLDFLISTGEVQFIHVPAGSRIPGGYVALGDTAERRPQPRSQRRIFSLALTECAPPGPDVVPAVGTWTTVMNTFETWADVLAAFETWGDLMQLVGSPEDVIVP
ncbi:MAG TPA: poly-gamma-glutamate hydrolase family protein [Trueperaceae bacterium]